MHSVRTSAHYLSQLIRNSFIPRTTWCNMSAARFIVLTLVTATIVYLGLMGLSWLAEELISSDTPDETSGRIQLVLDEQEIGLVRLRKPLQVPFAIANIGTGKLILRQAAEECCGAEFLFPTITIEPGKTGEVIALLSSDDLLSRGRKHIRFHTTDPDHPELWLTIRGTVIRNASSTDD